MKSIIINSSHTSSSSNSVFTYKFPTPIEFKKGDKIGLKSLTVPYSWGNINKQLYQNNTLQLVYNGVTTNLTLDDGWYDVDALNAALANLIIRTDNNLPYYLNDQKEPIFFISII